MKVLKLIDIKILLASYLLLLPISSIAENIVEIDRGNTPGRLYIDTDSIMRDKEKVEFWYILDVYAAHRKKGTRVYGYNELKPLKYYKSNKINVAFNCKTKEWLPIKIMEYDQAVGKGPLVGSTWPYEHENIWRKIVQGDTFSLLMPHVCNV